MAPNASPPTPYQLWAPNSPTQPQPASVSILVSKTAGRYRVQSDCLAALYCVSSELERRLCARLDTAHSSSSSSPSSSQSLVTCGDAFPFAEYFAAIQAHLDTRHNLVSLYSRLNDAAHLFRLAQKKLLARFKDKNPVPLAGVDVVMRETYMRTLQVADEAEARQRLLARQSQDLACLSRLLVHMTALRLGLPAAARSLLESYLCVSYIESTGGNDETSSTGWEETVDASMTFLLKTLLAKQPAKQPRDGGQLSSSLDLPGDLEGLKKHIAVVFDRIEKGAQLVGGGEFESRK